MGNVIGAAPACYRHRAVLHQVIHELKMHLIEEKTVPQIQCLLPFQTSPQYGAHCQLGSRFRYCLLLNLFIKEHVRVLDLHIWRFICSRAGACRAVFRIIKPAKTGIRNALLLKERHSTVVEFIPVIRGLALLYEGVIVTPVNCPSM